MTWLGFLNFGLLQWFGIRLARVTEMRPIPGDLLGFLLWKDGAITEAQYKSQRVTVGWKVLRWIVPLTGWWSDYRWIARRR